MWPNDLPNELVAVYVLVWSASSWSLWDQSAVTFHKPTSKSHSILTRIQVKCEHLMGAVTWQPFQPWLTFTASLRRYLTREDQTSYMAISKQKSLMSGHMGLILICLGTNFSTSTSNISFLTNIILLDIEITQFSWDFMLAWPRDEIWQAIWRI